MVSWWVPGVKETFEDWCCSDISYEPRVLSHRQCQRIEDNDILTGENDNETQRNYGA